MIDSSEEIRTIFVANAVTRTQTQIFEDDELQTPKATLEGKTNIQIISRTQNICYVMWEDEGNLYLGYAKYEDLNDGSITIGQIIGLIVMLLAIIAIAVTFRFIKNSRKKLALDYEK